MFKQMNESTLTMDWRIVQATIFLFCLVAGVYRQVLRRHPWDSLVLLLLPELFTNILLGIIAVVIGGMKIFKSRPKTKKRRPKT